MSNNLQAAALVLVPGNNLAKVEKYTNFGGLSLISPTFFRVQRKWWQWMTRELVVESENEELVVSGDGQYFLPGFSAMNLCYFLTEVVTEYIQEVEVINKRHVGMKLSTMETKALKKMHWEG